MLRTASVLCSRALFLGLFLALRAIAQPSEEYRSSDLASRGYWRLRTDYASRQTVVRFYDGQNQLLYEEVLRGRYIPLNNRNVRELNQTFARLLDRQLLQAALRPRPLLEPTNASDPGYQYDGRRKPEPIDTPVAPEGNASGNLTVSFYQTVRPLHFKLIFKNPAGGQVRIRIVNWEREYVYQEVINHAQQYNRTFNLSPLPNGTYTFEVEGPRNTYRQLLRFRGSGTRQAEILEMPVIRPAEEAESLQ